MVQAPGRLRALPLAALLGALAMLTGCAGSPGTVSTNPSPAGSPGPTATPATGATPASGLSSRYPRDIGVERDPDVLFAEMGEEATLSALFANWSGNSTANSLALDSSALPPLSTGRQSIRLFTTAGPLGPGTVRSAGLYKSFGDGYDGPVFARWYVKYNTTGTFHHSGPRLGGNFPPSSSQPNSPAGVRPSGDDFFYLGAELSAAKTAPAARSTVDFYNYWPHQRGTSFFPGQYFGNSFINDPAVSIDLGAWNCIEVQLTLNHPVSAFSGEIAMWLNGVEVSRVGMGTRGTWDEDNFHPDPQGAPFEGFQWRSDDRLKINYFQLLHFVDQDPPGAINSINFDHIVVARRYVGPIAP